MAERRMFSRKVIKSDAFTDMPLSSQALYMHLAMEADDDGFLNNAKQIKKMVNASDDDLKLLVAKQFIIVFPSGVVVIAHWHVQNQLRKDKYKPTELQEERQFLSVNANGVYVLKYDDEADGNRTQLTKGTSTDGFLATIWQPNGNRLEPKCSEVKESVVKDSIGECMCALGKEQITKEQYDTLVQKIR